ncbi:hypothetical protein [Nesterenkonia alkaliphila]|uniref:Uncharacterized protein n=1 Tax=Nesterenkonia alkaliphila TaxID=1463631 RepID=A0A7K1ULV6_9MICC|nr:hypothetical protein [Nesterenkonia alkaliphila]MVT27459.1 hypothetical protein [Nesterenkonia alkaliphila]GFZ89491.1 hypothetical protein GCM10011359_18620 [Nesterenkonia alkaliphila]
MSKPSAPLHSPDSLTAAEYDSWCLRAELLARQMSIANYPGDVVFTIEPAATRLAFTQIGSYGVTYAGMGLDKTSPKTWKLLKHAGLPVPHYKVFSRDKGHEAQGFAQKHGYPVVVAGVSGASRRTAADKDELTEALHTLRSKSRGQLLVNASVNGPALRLLVHQDQVVAISQSRSRAYRLDEVSESLKNFAVAAVRAIPGIDTAGVTIVAPSPEEPRAEKNAVLERVMHHPHLRDYVGRSDEAALALAGELILAEARRIGAALPEPAPRGNYEIRLCSVPSPASFAAKLSELIGAFGSVHVHSGPEQKEKGLYVQLEAASADAALIITQALGGLPGGGSAHAVTVRLMD